MNTYVLYCGAQTFRYSNDEREIEDALKGYVRNLKDRIEEALKQ